MIERTLSKDCPEVIHVVGDTALLYRLRQGNLVEWMPLPADAVNERVQRRGKGPLHPSQADTPGLLTWNNRMPDPLVQVSLRGTTAPGFFCAGESMRNGEVTQSMAFVDQRIERQAEEVRVVTRLESPFGVTAEHTVIWSAGDGALRVETVLQNVGEDPVEVEMLSSFSLTGITPFVDDDAPGRLRLHRFRSAWSAEGRHEVLAFEAAHLERTWGALPVVLRYGQTGSMPVRGFFPFIAIEDTVAGVFWGAQLAWHGSWQMEVHRIDDAVSISGGLGDFERSHWMKSLAAGDRFAAPTALVATGRGDLDAFCARLVEAQARLAYPEPEHEQDLPIIFNEWCSTWGKPTHDYIVRTASKLASTPTRYLVIDDGWAEKPEGADIQFNGDWIVDRKAFPDGLAATAAAVKERGLIPGIWFEFEPCTKGTRAYDMTDHHLHRHGKVIQVGRRHFWDFRDPFTFEYLTEKVIRLLRDNGFGYLKVDYNETIGVGCDGAESLGEGLRQHLEKVKEFFARIRKEVPGIVIENCSSGGHRLEAGMIALTSMSSFSDAHENVEIPIIAASLHRLVPAAKNQVWAVLRPGDSEQRLRYSLAATFLGRMCVSGDLVDLSDDRFAVVEEAQHFYRAIVPVIREGRSQIHSSVGSSWRYPAGWQALTRLAADGRTLLVVLHTFAGVREPMQVPLPKGAWAVADAFGAPEIRLEGEALHVPALPEFTGCAWNLKS